MNKNAPPAAQKAKRVRPKKCVVSVYLSEEALGMVDTMSKDMGGAARSAIIEFAIRRLCQSGSFDIPKNGATSDTKTVKDGNSGTGHSRTCFDFIPTYSSGTSDQAGEKRGR